MGRASARPLTRREKVERKEKALLSAARTLFLERGYDGVRTADLAKRVQISEGSIYSYFKNKSELMQGVVVDFWREIAEGAHAAIAAGDPPMEQLHDLAVYHLATVIDNFDFLDLTFSLRRAGEDIIVSRDDVRTYTSVFDEIMNRAIDRGDLASGTVIWLVRDTFYGTLEYSARTILGRSTKSSTDMNLVVDNLLEQIRRMYGANAQSQVNSQSPNEAITQRLERIAETFEVTIEQFKRQNS